MEIVVFARSSATSETNRLSSHFILELGKYNLQPADITHVVCTHGHSDHIGCNHLFLNAKVHIVGNSVSHRESYYLHNFVAADYVIDDGVRVVRTPGHTLDSVSVLVSPTNLASCVAICGDLFENRDDVLDPSLWIDAGSESVGEQREHRHKIAMEADIIVPGHGGLFHVTDEIRNKLERNLHD